MDVAAFLKLKDEVEVRRVTPGHENWCQSPSLATVAAAENLSCPASPGLSPSPNTCAAIDLRPRETDGLRHFSCVRDGDVGYERVKGWQSYSVLLARDGVLLSTERKACSTVGCLHLRAEPDRQARCLAELWCAECKEQRDNAHELARRRFTRPAAAHLSATDKAQRAADYERLGVVAQQVFGQVELLEHICANRVGYHVLSAVSQLNRAAWVACRTSYRLLFGAVMYGCSMSARDFRGVFALSPEQAHKYLTSGAWSTTPEEPENFECRIYKTVIGPVTAELGGEAQLMAHIRSNALAANAEFWDDRSKRALTSEELGRPRKRSRYPRWMLDESARDPFYKLPRLDRYSTRR